MAKVVFPSNPSVDDVYTANGRSWKWDGKRWKSFAAAAPQTFEEDVTITSNLIIDSTQPGTAGIRIKRDNSSDNDALLFWDESSETWRVKDTDENYSNKKIVIEYDTLDGGNY